MGYNILSRNITLALCDGGLLVASGHVFAEMADMSEADLILNKTSSVPYLI